MAAAESAGPRADQSLRVVKARAAAGKAEAEQHEVVGHPGFRGVMALQALEHLEGALLGSARRQLDVGDQIALVLGGQKGAGQAAIERHQGRQQDGEQQEIGQQSADGAGHPAFETAGQAFEAPVEGAEEAAAGMGALGNRLEQGGAQRRGQAQGEKGGKQDGHRHGRRELAIDDAHRTAHEGHGHEDRGQHQGDADDGAGDLAHGLARGRAGIKSFRGHESLDVFHHHNGVVHQDTDGQHHAKQGQHIDRIAQRQEHGAGAQQCHRHHQGRDQGVAQILQEQVHHREHQRHGLQQGVDDLGDGDLDEGRRVVGDVVLHPRRKVPGQFGQLGAHRLGGGQGIGGGRQLHADRHRGLAVQPGAEVVALAAHLDPGDIAQGHAGAIGPGAQQDAGEFGRVAELALDQHRRVQLLTRGGGQLAETAGRHLDVLLGDGAGHVGRGQADRHQATGVEPDAQGVLGAKQLGLAHPVQPAQFVDHVARQVVAQGGGVEARVGGGEGDEQQVAGGSLLDLDALLGDRPRQARLHHLEAILDVHLGQLRIGAGLEGHGQGGAALAAAGREVEQVIDAIEFLLDQADHTLVQGLRRGARIAQGQLDLRRRHVGILGHRQLRQGQQAGEQDEQRHHPGEHRAVDEEIGHQRASAGAA